jgi:chromosome segregation ATPase
VKRLREYCSIDKGADPIMLKVLSVVRPDLSDAADRIEALEGEVTRLQVECAENERLWEEARNLAELNGEVADSAMKCAERMRAALEDIKRISRHRLTDKCDAINQRASEALSTSGSDASASPEGCDTDQPPSGIAPRPLGKT